MRSPAGNHRNSKSTKKRRKPAKQTLQQEKQGESASQIRNSIIPMFMVPESATKAQRRLVSLAAALFFALTVFLFSLFKMYITNIDALWFTASTVVPYVGLICFTAFSVVFLACRFLPWTLGRLAVAGVFGFTLAYYIEGTYLPADYIKLDGAETVISTGTIALSSFLWVVLLLLPFVLLFLVKESFRNVVVAVSFSLIVVQGVFAVPDVIGVLRNSEISYVATKRGQFTLSSDENIIVLLLDCFDTEFFEIFAERNPEYRDAFSDFIYYSDVTSSSNYTTQSIMSVLTGRMPVDVTDNFKYPSFFVESGFLTELKEHEYDTRLFAHNSLIPFNIPEERRKVDNVVPISDLVDADMAKILTEKLYKLTFLRYLPAAVKQRFLVQYYEFEALIPMEEEKVDVSNASLSQGNRDIVFYENLQQGFELIDKPAYRFYHFQGNHAPWTMTSNLQQVEQMDGWTGPEQQAEGILKIAISFLEKLKEQGIYDNSMIFVMADHGSLDASATNGAMTSYGTPLLLFKDIGVRKDSLTVSNAQVANYDVFSTVMSYFRPSVQEYEEYSLRNAGLENLMNRERPFYLSMASYSYKEYYNTGSSRNLNDWHETGDYIRRGERTPMSFQPYLLGTEVNAEALVSKDKLKEGIWPYAWRGIGSCIYDQAGLGGDYGEMIFNISNSVTSDLRVNIYATEVFPHEGRTQRVFAEVNGHNISDQWSIAGPEEQLISFVVPRSYIGEDNILKVRLLVPDSYESENISRRALRNKISIQLNRVVIEPNQ